MRKKMFALCLVVVVLGGVFFVGRLGHNTTNVEQVMLEKGKEILKETFPEVYEAIEKDIVAEEKDGVWTIYNDFERIKYFEDGSKLVSFGGVYYVKIDAVTGDVLDVAVGD